MIKKNTKRKSLNHPQSKHEISYIFYQYSDLTNTKALGFDVIDKILSITPIFVFLSISSNDSSCPLPALLLFFLQVY